VFFLRYVIVYWSRYGNGKKVVENLASTLKKRGADTKVYQPSELDPAKMPEADIYVFSAAVEAFNIQKNMRTFMKNLESMENRKYGIINTHAMKKNRLYKMEKLLSKKSMVKVAELDFQIGEGSQSGNGLPAGWEAKVKQFASKL
jgi:flavodoxin